MPAVALLLDSRFLLLFLVQCPGATRCRTVCLRYTCFISMRPAAHSGQTASFPASGETGKKVASKSRGVDGDKVSLPALLLPERHRASAVGTVPVSLRVLLSTLLLDIKDDAMDRFM
jgi:hypothetical protein